MLPPFWTQLAELGWLGLHLPEDVGGSGYGLAELAVVLEELGRVCAPGPFLPTVLASTAIVALADDDVRGALLPALADGSATAAVQFGGAGTPVLGGSLADLFVIPADAGWHVVRAEECTVMPRTSVDETRRVADVDASTATPIGFLEDLNGDTVTDLALTLIAAECAGGAAWCVETAAEYARVREQFGRPIGQFQGVKHRCADMLLALEQARAAAWDAGRPTESADERSLSASVAGALAPAAFFQCAKDCIQVLGGIGFTWEHDAHLYLKRAAALRALTGGGPHEWRQRTLGLARRGTRRTLAVDLPSDAAAVRDEIRAELADIVSHDKSDWRRLLADRGYLAPHWPKPWG